MVIQLKEQTIKEIVKSVLENVFIDSNKVNRKQKTIGLTYKKGRGQKPLTSADQLKTDKMDEDNATTYKVMLKGGIVSYNITDIKGTEVMHYFKRLWDKKPTKIDIQVNGENQKEAYELKMLKEEEVEFLNRFKEKIEFVLDNWYGTHKQNAKEFTGISIYPVPSSSNFNSKMAELLSDMNVYGLPVQVINQNLLVKDLRNLQKDNDFIEKNKDYFNQPFFKNDVSYKSGSTLQNIDTSLNRYKVLNTANKYIEKKKKKAGQILTKLSYIKTRSNNDNNTENERRKLAADYIVYYNTIMECYQLTYHDEISNTDKGFKNKSLINIIKYSKGPSIKARSSEIWSIIKTYLRGKICHITGEPYSSIDIGFWSKPSFEIKTLGNSVRLALKNIYNPNMDPELVKNELNKINGTIFVIFDDNISGGATLSDICYQCDQLGIKNIVPITFGVMNEKWTLGRMPLTIPSEKDSENRAKFNY